MMKIALSGFGKMSKEVFALIALREDVKVTAILKATAKELQGVKVVTTCQDAFNDADVVIDFSNHKACADNMALAAGMGKNLVIGTTGMTAEDIQKVRDAVKNNNTSGVISSNFSVGVNVFLETAKFLFHRLKGYDVEAIDIHHRAKKDSPSGTMMKLLNTLEAQNLVHGRKGLGERQNNEIGVHALRIGDVIGDHGVIFGGNSERIELWHKATSRRCFAEGTLLAAQWVMNKKDGILHEFRDCLLQE